MAEFSAVKRVETDEERSSEFKRIFEALHKIDPNNVLCAMVMVVERKDANGKNQIHSHIVGTDPELAKMLTMQVNMVRNGLVQINTPPPTDEVQH